MKSKLALSAVVALSALMGCGTPDRGTSSTGGTSGTGGGSGGATTGNGGTSSTASGDSGGTTSSGGARASGGATGSGGAPASGGSTGSGGAISSGGVSGSGGATGSGGAPASGGSTGAGGMARSGGVSGSGGATGSGGAPASGGSTGGSIGTGPQGPCDIYQAASPPTPCAAAHSTVRALYAGYTGPLYQLRKKSDSSTKDVPVGAGGFVDISVHNSFCPSGTACTISVIYDQSPNMNDLKKSGTALWLKNGGNEADASLGKITVSGHVAHGIYVDNDGSTAKDVAYRNNATKGMATGDQPEAMNAVLDG